jgi:hypothetical protein
MDRIMGVITLKAPTYREIAEDPNATQTAAIIVAVVALISGFVSGLIQVDPNNPQAMLPPDVARAVVAAIAAVIFALIGWFVSAWVLAFVAKWFGGKTNTQEMLRVTGFVEVFGLVGVLSILALVSPTLLCIAGIIGLVAAILRLIGYIIGVREAAEFSTGNAIITAIIAAIVNFIIVVIVAAAVVGALIAAIGIGSAAAR